MKLEEAIDTLKNKICDYVIPNYCKDCANKPECLDDCNFILSIYTVLQEIEHLQKENEELKEVNKLVEKFPVDTMSDDTKLILITKGNFLSNPCFKNLLDDYISKKKIIKAFSKYEEKRKKGEAVIGYWTLKGFVNELLEE